MITSDQVKIITFSGYRSTINLAYSVLLLFVRPAVQEECEGVDLEEVAVRGQLPRPARQRGELDDGRHAQGVNRSRGSKEGQG